MENYQGDLTDIFRASGGGGGALPQSNNNDISSREFSADPNLSSDANLFGDPFSNMRDPLLHHLNDSFYFVATDHNMLSVDETGPSTCTISGANSLLSRSINNHQNVVFDDEMNKSPCDIFSRVQISHDNDNNPTTLGFKASSSSSSSSSSSMVSVHMTNTNSSKICLVDTTAPLQISSPRNLGIKRRKSQAKKVVCIAAPAVGNSRQSGEVVPSDLWAWRKYGQKPIKGSPYPRGYYRCSSSKGCSARKQVERSRTDPHMLVISYTSEHNHPWPTQRNALAGSTRSSQNNNVKTTNKEEQKESSSTNDTTSALQVKQENNEELNDVRNSYRPTLPLPATLCDDFFEDLGEIEANDHKKQTKALDPFALLDWSAGDQNNNISTGQG